MGEESTATVIRILQNHDNLETTRVCPVGMFCLLVPRLLAQNAAFCRIRLRERVGKRRSTERHFCEIVEKDCILCRFFFKH